jgi:hypothetical protein
MIIQKLMNNIFIRDFLLPSNPFKKGQHPTLMIQNVVLHNIFRKTNVITHKRIFSPITDPKKII